MGKIRSFLGYAGLGIIPIAILALVVLAPSRWPGASEPVATGEASGWKYISAKPLLDDIKVLASDKFEGRAPATKGEKLTLAYLEKRFKEIGLEPGNPNGTYLQKVPMVGITADPSAQLGFTKSGSNQTIKLQYGDEFVAWTKRMVPSVHVDAPLVFVGYGVVAPEYHWDDYEGVDVKGKILVMLVNDPPVPDPHDPSKLDPRMFKGKAMTYYGRWTYKYEIAAKKGAAGALVVHETGRLSLGSREEQQYRRAI